MSELRLCTAVAAAAADDAMTTLTVNLVSVAVKRDCVSCWMHCASQANEQPHTHRCASLLVMCSFAELFECMRLTIKPICCVMSRMKLCHVDSRVLKDFFVVLT